jgi:Holliday junction resolvasome RuvABC endonuclease subunit
MTEAQVQHMVDRFLAWKLPEAFRPDGGITFKAEFNEHTDHPMKHEPSGTNLLDASQAQAMVRHMLDGLPQG